MLVDQALADRAVREALARFPAFEEFGPRLAYHDLPQGGAFTVAFNRHPGRDATGLWDFQNAVVGGYKRLTGGGADTGYSSDCGG